MADDERFRNGKSDGGEREPDPVPGTVDLRTLSITGLFVLALVWAVDVARPILLPVVAAALLSALFAPLVRGLARWHLPRSLTAGAIVLLLAGGLVFGIQQLGDPASEWLEKAPTTFRQLERELRDVKSQVEKVSDATEQVEELTRVGADKPAASAEPSQPSLAQRLLRGGWRLIVSIFLTFILLFFILSSDDLFLRKLVQSMPRLREKRLSVEAVRTIQRDISRYLATITLINAALGGAVALAMWWLELPNPTLWGAMAMLFNFVPYLGAVVGVSIVAVAGIVTFDGWWASLTPALVYLALTSLEGYVLTPLALSRRLTLNPLAILLAVVFWGWLWGVPGALVAVPLLACLKILFNRFQVLVPLAEFLEGD
ncbi:MAG: AI-2E family transporter [Thermoanaerobaculia bacterium]